MPTNAEIRTIQFMQGVAVSLPASVLDDSGNKLILNNAANASTGLKFDIDVYREVIIDYSLRRRTDATTGLIQRGRMRLTANPDALLLADKWILSEEFKNDEGTPPGITFSILVAPTLDDASAEVDLLYSSTDLIGANHDCVMSYALTSFLV
jgi:hypothetical protein